MKKCFIAMVLLISVQSCRTDSVDDYEMKVLVEIFDDVIDEMGVLSGLEIPPPPISVSDNNVTEYDTIEYNRKIDDIERKNNKMKDTTLVLAVFDTLFACYDKNLDVEYIRKQLTNRDYINVLEAMNNHSIKNRPLNLSQISKRKGFTLRYYSEFPKKLKLWKRENYNFHFLGVLKISRNYLDEKKQVGLFYCSYACGRLCGEDAIICIRKINDKWTIEKKILLGVS